MPKMLQNLVAFTRMWDILAVIIFITLEHEIIQQNDSCLFRQIPRHVRQLLLLRHALKSMCCPGTPSALLAVSFPISP